MRIIKLISLLAIVAVITGCAHPLVISPDISKVERTGNAQTIDKNVGYYIPADIRDKAVKTKGGGGDFVTYTPYRDMETAFYKMLSNVFKSVTVLKSANDTEAIAKHSINYIITPEITTESSSPSAFTWPPTKFSVTLTCNITNTSGKVIGKPAVTGEGNAEFSEFKSDVSLSGKRATLDSLLKMQDTLLKMPELRAP
jgi:hypothetical protein